MLFSSSSSLYSLKKSKKILRHTFHFLSKRKKKLAPEILKLFKETITSLQEAIIQKNRVEADKQARYLESLHSVYLKKKGRDQIKEFVFALGFALIVAVFVRQMWFEFYEIPTGSMRPTFKEQDRLIVSKADFGINIPLKTAHFYFDPTLVKRNNIVIFTGENMDIRDVDTLYFYLFPGKKQYIKRLIGKPQDILYFYGGLIYGMDGEGKDISYELQPEMLFKIEHIPFIDFDRKLVLPPSPTNTIYSPAFIYQMNEPIAKLYNNSQQQIVGEMIVPREIHDSNAPKVKDYGDLWGIKNYAMVRLLGKNQTKTLTDQDPNSMPEGVLYLEIRHHPTLNSVKLIRDEFGRLRPTFGLSTSLIPLQEKHLKELFKHMYTARFEVKNGAAFRYGIDPKQATKNIFSPRLAHIPDGVYEFYEGKAYQIFWQGVSKELSQDHPIYRFDPQIIQLFFNLGIEWDTRFAPQVKNQRLTPARYSYFRSNDLYLLGAPILLKEDPILIDFLKREHQRKETALKQYPYQPFEDLGPPLKSDGTLDIEFIAQNGLLIPQEMYLVLGDNHAMSSDSRDFGFVPQRNLRGGPDFIFWPPGPRFGHPLQPGYPFLVFPRIIVWILAGICMSAGSLYWLRRNRIPLRLDKF